MKQNDFSHKHCISSKGGNGRISHHRSPIRSPLPKIWGASDESSSCISCSDIPKSVVTTASDDDVKSLTRQNIQDSNNSKRDKDLRTSWKSKHHHTCSPSSFPSSSSSDKDSLPHLNDNTQSYNNDLDICNKSILSFYADTTSKKDDIFHFPSENLPQYIENVVYHKMMSPPIDAKLMKEISKCIILPENPSDPAAFTITPGFTRIPKPPWCSSKPVQKIVGTFVILMSIGILAAVLYVNWCSDTFRPMMNK